MELNRKFYLIGEVTEESVKDIVIGIREIHYYDRVYHEELKDYEAEPIELFIDSYGGEAHSALLLGNVILEARSTTPVYTYCYGKAMSAGLFIFIHGEHRLATESTQFMEHQLSAGTHGKLGDMQIAIANHYTKLHETLNKRLLTLTNISEEVLKQKHLQKEDWHFEGIDAVKLGVVTDLIEFQFEEANEENQEFQTDEHNI